jgi:hypothetical protein
MTTKHLFEYGGLVTLAVSLWIAFGPLRHRLPKILTRYAKISAALKLTGLSVVCWIACWHAWQEHASHAARWSMALAGVVLLAAAVFVLTRRTPAAAGAAAEPVGPSTPPPPSPTASSPPVVREPAPPALTGAGDTLRP